MRVGSLFSGYGGAELAVQAIWPNAHPAWFVEFDKNPSTVLAHHWPDVPNHGDVTTVDWNTVDPVDILTGGYPCQPFSHAGQRKGTNDERHLFPYVEAAISVLRPRLVLLENVVGHLSLGGPEVIGTLTRLGYSVRWGTVRASDADAPHRRARLFIAATADTCRGPLAGPAATGDGLPVVAERGSVAPADTDRPGRSQQRRAITIRPQQPPVESLGTCSRCDECTTVYGGDYGPQWCRGCLTSISDGELLPTPTPFTNGNNETPSEWLVRRADVVRRTGTHHGLPLAVAAASISAGRPISQRDPMKSLQQEQPCVNEDAAASSDFGPYAAAIARWEHILGRPAPAPTEPGRDDRPRLSPAFVEFMMGLPEGHVTAVPGVSRVAQLKMLGNGIVPQQMALALQLILGMDAQPVAHDDAGLLGTPTTGDAHGGTRRADFAKGRRPELRELHLHLGGDA